MIFVPRMPYSVGLSVMPVLVLVISSRSSRISVYVVLTLVCSVRSSSVVVVPPFLFPRFFKRLLLIPPVRRRIWPDMVFPLVLIMALSVTLRSMDILSVLCLFVLAPDISKVFRRISVNLTIWISIFPSSLILASRRSRTRRFICSKLPPAITELSVIRLAMPSINIQ